MARCSRPMARRRCCAPPWRRKSAKPGQDFFPLTVNYQEKTFAAGKIPGGFFKREGRPSEKETLTSRLIDRPIRPLFVPGFRNETQVVCTVLSHDLENDPDVVALVGASAALTISGIPFMGPIAGCRVGYIDGEYVLNPTIDQLPRSQLDLLVAGTGEGVLMVESEAKELSEDIMLGAVTFGHKSFQPVIDAIIELAETCAKEPWTLAEPPANKAAIEQRLQRGGRPADRGRLSRAQQAGAQQPARRGQGRARPRCSTTKPSEPSRSSCSRTSRRTSCAARSCATAPASTAATPRRCGRSTARSACCRGRTARCCSPAARRRRSSSRRSAPARTSRSSTRSKASTAKTSCCTTTSRPTRPARPGAWDRRGGARSATASSPGARCGRCCRRRRASPTRSASCPRSPSRTARRRWPRCAAPRWR